MPNPSRGSEREELFAMIRDVLEARRRRHRRAVLALEIVKISTFVILVGYAVFMLGRGLAFLIM